MGQHRKFGLADIVAILACVSVGVGIIYSVAPKTAAEMSWFVLVWILFLVAVMIGVRAFHREKTRWAAGVLLGLVVTFVCALVVKHVWPDTRPTTDIIAGPSQILPFIIDVPPRLNIGLYNSSPYTIDAFRLIYVGPSLGVASFGRFGQEEVYRLRTKNEDDWWQEHMVHYVATHNDTPQYTLASRQLLWYQLQGSTITNLSQTDVENLQADNHLSAVYFMMLLLYEDRSGTHELDICRWMDNTRDVKPCTHHNGPVEPVPHKPLHESKWYYLWLN